MAERKLALSRIVRLEGGELAEVNVRPDETPWALIALAGILLVGTAWWAAMGD